MSTLHSIAQWLEKAESDMTAATDLYRLRTKALDAICYHCQQTAEKYIKAVMVANSMDVPRTHNLPRLIGLLAAVARMDETRRREAAWLSEFAVEIRYPSEKSLALCPKDAARAIQAASDIRDFCLQLLPPAPSDHAET